MKTHERAMKRILDLKAEYINELIKLQKPYDLFEEIAEITRPCEPACHNCNQGIELKSKNHIK